MSIQQTLEKILRQVKEGMHPSDLVDLVDELTDAQKKELFELLSDEEAALIIQEMEEFDQVSLIRLLTGHRASAILKEMAVDDAADLLRELPPELTRELLSLIEEEAEEIRGLLKYREDTAGGIMTTDFISLPEDIPVEEAIIRLREVAPEAEIIYYVYVVDEQTRLSGVLSLRDLIAAQDGTLLREIMYRNVISVPTDMDQEEVARVVARYDLLAVPVVDEEQRLLGIITVDDIIDVIEEEATEDIYRLAGTGEVEGVNILEASVFGLARRRFPWLVISLLGGLLSGSVIGVFEATLQSIVLLAVFIPVIMGMGGNVGTQSSTLFVRGLATGEIKSRDVWSYLFREVKVGLAMGLANGVIIALAGFLWTGIPALGLPNGLIIGLAVGLAMFLTITLAAIIGTMVPAIFNYYGVDPAISAGPFVTTIQDVIGLLNYLYTASMFLNYLA
ncbi:MAG TPA: magnesium transporter [Firmicutes bacterium]|nr:magnesium transporter [Bacillota bacterium]